MEARGAAEGREQAGVDSVRVYGSVEDCAGQRKNTRKGRANIPGSGNNDTSRTPESFVLGDLKL